MLNPKEKKNKQKSMIMIIYNTVITVGENKVEQGEAAVVEVLNVITVLNVIKS